MEGDPVTDGRQVVVSGDDATPETAEDAVGDGPVGTIIGAVPPTAEVEPTGPGFTEEVAAKLKSYVYLLVDPRTGRPFAVGRGKGDRCFSDLDALRRAAADGSAQPSAVRVREIEDSGRPVRIDILRHGLDGDASRLVEAATVDALGLDPAGISGAGRRQSVEAVATALARPAKFKRSHPVVLLRVAADDMVDPSDRAWRVARRWTDLDSPRSPRWAVLVVDDLVREVVRIDGWEPTGPADSAATRYRLRGERDVELEDRYVGRSVAAYRTSGSQNPVGYVWCGPHWVNRPR